MLLKKSSLVMLVLLLGFLLSGQSSTFGQGDPSLQFEIYGNSPIISTGVVGEWDSGFMSSARVLDVDGVFHMFYLGGENQMTSPWHVGYASSTDGIEWTKFDGNPILQLDPSFASHDVQTVAPFFDGEQWTLYLAPKFTASLRYPINIVTATAPEPTGSWEINTNSILEAGTGRAWDTRIAPMSVVQDGETTYLYYGGFGGTGSFLGLATSTDGVEWTKYHDPANDTAAYRDSTPVFGLGETSSCDEGGMNAGGFVFRNGDNWELVYKGTTADGDAGICHATSDDGIRWIRQYDAPVFVLELRSFGLSFPSVLVVDSNYLMYFTGSEADSTDPWGIWLAIAPVPEE